MQRGANGRDHLWLRILITGSALTALVARILCPEFAERLDSISIALIVVSSVPWLAPIISKISIAGIEAELREMKADLVDTKEEAVLASRTAQRSQDTALFAAVEKGTVPSERVSSSARIFEMGNRYETIRSDMPSGAARTSKMDSLFAEMIQEATNLGRSWSEHAKALESDRPGEQLAALAYAYTFPQTIQISDILDVIERTPHPFIQYWGLEAIRRVLSERQEFSFRDISRLKELTSVFNPRTDRFLLVNSILRLIKGKLGS